MNDRSIGDAVDILCCAADLLVRHAWPADYAPSPTHPPRPWNARDLSFNAFAPWNVIEAAAYELYQDSVFLLSQPSRNHRARQIARGLRHVGTSLLDSEFAVNELLEAAAYLQYGDALFDTKAIPIELSEVLFWSAELTHDTIVDVLAYLPIKSRGAKNSADHLRHWLLLLSTGEFAYVHATPQRGTWEVLEVMATEIHHLGKIIFAHAGQRYQDLVEQLSLRQSDTMMALVTRQLYSYVQPGSAFAEQSTAEILRAAGAAQLLEAEDRAALAALDSESP